ncbi:Titin [Talaromyces islandicus]|uniref:Titin n=1 Tax=Talaromyces islandicus TaxID=28573 RepID=A0A0U1MA85_TALIS|nr:Titin [Talaromyces islandicus]
MPRTRSQAGVSPLVSLDAPRRTRKIASSSTTTSSSQETMTAKLKRARKPKATTPASQDEPVDERRPSMKTSENPNPNTQSPQEPKGKEPSSKEFSIATNMDEDADDETLSPSNYSASPLKRHSFKRTLATVKSALKRPSESLRQRFSTIRRSPLLSNDSGERMFTFTSTSNTQYALSENQILDAAAQILLDRMESDTIDRPGAASSFLRCPCCQGSLACPQGHDLTSWVPNDINESMNALLTTIFAEGVCASSEVREETLRNEQKRRTQVRQRSQEQPEKPETAKENGQKPPEPTPKPKSKKRVRSNDDDKAGPDGEPASQRPRLTPKPTPYKRRTTAPRQRLTNAQIRQRANDWETGNRPPSMFRLDEAIAHHEAEEKEEAAARKAAEEAAENERLEMITRAAMERHAVLGQVPDNMGNSLEIPIYSDPDQDVETPRMPQAAEAPTTPSSSSWGFPIRNLFSSVSHSMSRFVPRFRTVTDQAVPFVAGGGATPTETNGAVASGASSTSVHPSVAGSAESETARNDHGEMDLTYSLFPPKLKLPSTPAPRVHSEENTVAAQPVDAATPMQSSVQSSTNTEIPTKSAAVAAPTTPHEPPASQPNRLAEVSGNEQHGKAHDEADIAPKKRKRPPSPDVIPNPVGSSYGLDLDYFMYSSEDEDEDETEQPEASLAANKPPEKRVRIESPPRPTTTPKAPAPTAARTETEAASPYIAPGWNRPTTTVYNGSLFQGRAPINTYTQEMSQPQGGWPHPMDSPRVSHPQPSTGSLLEIREDHKRKHFLRSIQNANVNNLSGKPKTPQFAPFSFTRPSVPEEAAGSNARPPTNIFAQPSSAASQSPSIAPSQPSAAPPPPQPSAAATFQPPAVIPAASTTTPREDSEKPEKEPKTNGVSPFENVESLPQNVDPTEKHKPKSPSKLRHPTQFSSSPVGSPERQNEEDLRQVFGEDEAGQQAYDLFQSCPSGDLSKLSWPKFDTVPNDDIQQMVNATNYTQGHEDEIRETFQQSFQNFQKELDEGLVDTDELLEGLPI